MQQLRVTRARRVALIGLAGALAVSISACADSKREEGAGGGSGGTMVFGAAGNPKTFDPLFRVLSNFASIGLKEARYLERHNFTGNPQTSLHRRCLLT